MAMSKVKKVKQHLEQGKRINALTGFALFGTMRMSAIIHNLKNVLKELKMLLKRFII